MSNAARTSYVAAVVLALLGASALMVVAGSGIPDDTAASSGSGTGGADVAKPTVRFAISGDVSTTLAPGVSAPINLEITNPHRTRLRVGNLRVTIQEVSAPGATAARPCTVSDFVVHQLPRHHKRIRLKAHVTQTLRSLHLHPKTWPRVGMHNHPVNQDGCKGAALTLGYAGSGTLARR